MGQPTANPHECQTWLLALEAQYRANRNTIWTNYVLIAALIGVLVYAFVEEVRRGGVEWVLVVLPLAGLVAFLRSARTNRRLMLQR